MTRLLLVGVFAIVSFSFFGANQANAITPNDIPDNIRAQLRAYDNQCGSIAEKYRTTIWLSLKDKPRETEATVDRGTTTIPMQINMLDMVCYDHVNGNGVSYPNLPGDGNPFGVPTDWSRYKFTSVTANLGTITNAGSTLNQNRYVTKSASSRYWFSQDQTSFDYKPTGGIKAEQTVNITAKGIGLRSFHGGGTYICIGGNVSNFNADGCGESAYGFSMKIKVKESPPQGNFEDLTCAPKAVGWAWDPDYSGAIEVHLWADGEYSTSPYATLAQATTANIFRTDLKNAGIGNGQHGFSATSGLDGLIDARRHVVKAYAINYGGGDNPLIGTRTVGPCYSYELTPQVDGSTLGDTAIAGQEVTVPSSIVNAGKTKSKDGTQWQLTIMTTKPGNDPPNLAAAKADSKEPCTDAGTGYFKTTTTSCQPLKTGKGFLVDAHQMWYKSSTTTGTVIRVGRDANKCLDASGTSIGSVVNVYDCHGGPNQRWDILSNGSIRDTRSKLCLDVEAAGVDINGASKIQLYTCKATYNQLWTFGSDNSLKLKTKSKCLDADANGLRNGDVKVKIQMWDCTTSGAMASGTTTLAAQKAYVDDLPVGTDVCFALSVKEHSDSDARWMHSKTECVTVSEKPKIQVWGSDVMAGRAFAGYTAPTSSDIRTSMTIKTTPPQKSTAPQSFFTGLCNTGVVSCIPGSSGYNQKLAAGKTDPNWTLQSVYNPKGSKPCQTGTFPRSATTITEQNGTAGSYVGSASGPWFRTVPNARWVGQNQYGRNDSTSLCPDPSTLVAEPGDVARMPFANVYVFKLTKGFTITSGGTIDLSSVQLSVRGAVDNQIQFVVNGVALGGFQEPGFLSQNTSTTVVSPKPSDIGLTNIFKEGSNTLEIRVRSTYTHTGILIDEFKINADTYTTSGSVWGSWGEYGLLSTGFVRTMASGAGLNKDNDSISSAQSAWSKLTFANVPSGTCTAVGYGCYTTKSNAGTIPDVESRFFTSGSAVNYTKPTLKLSDETTGQHVYLLNTDLELPKSELKTGRSVIIKTTGNVTISGNLTYNSSPLTDIKQIPQLVIIAKNIYIKDSVERVDAWLIAKGTTANKTGILDTCDIDRINYKAKLTSQKCNKVLTVNGPVMAQSLWLRRTAGSGTGTASGSPAEIFNLRSDAYLWGLAQSAESSRLETIETRELPPRF